MIALRSTRPKVRHASVLADELLLRAKRQAKHGPDDMDRFLVETGLRAVDAVLNRLPGVSLFLGSEKRARTVLATQIAFETARSGKPVLWLCAGGYQDLALLMIMTRLAKLELRRVFVKRDLRPRDWRRLESAAAAVSKLPLRFADAHGADANDLEDAFCRSVAETRVEHQLVVVDHLDAPPKPNLPHLEQLSDVVRVPFLVLLDLPGDDLGHDLTVHETGLRDSSRVLLLERAPSTASLSKEAAPEEGDLILRVRTIAALSRQDVDGA